MSFAVQTNNQYAYLDEAYPGANEALQYTPKSDAAKNTRTNKWANHRPFIIILIALDTYVI